METVEFNSKEFNDLFACPYHIYARSDFNILNKTKVDEILFLGFKDKKYRLGIILGRNENTLRSPFSAPFGGFIYLKNDVRINHIDESIIELEKYAIKKELLHIEIALPPAIYNYSFISKQINSLYRANFNIDKIELNYHFDLKNFTANYVENIWYNARRNLKIALKEELSFSYCKNIQEKMLAYEIIKVNRKSKGFPLKMSWDQIFVTIEIIKADFFLVNFRDKTIASAMIYPVSNKIYQIVYWGDNPVYSELKPMNFLSYKIFEYYKKLGAEIIDIGTSTENSIPNLGLAEFKESIGCDITTKFILKKNYMKIELVNFSNKFLSLSWDWLNDEEVKKLTNTPNITKKSQEIWFNNLSEKSDYEIWGIIAEDKPIGACGLKNITEIDCEYWGYIGEKSFWGRGVGSMILSKLIEKAKQKQIKILWLKVLKDNIRAINLYKKYGFQSVGNFDDKQIRMELDL